MRGLLGFRCCSVLPPFHAFDIYLLQSSVFSRDEQKLRLSLYPFMSHPFLRTPEKRI